jgi:hypothetical protein
MLSQFFRGAHRFVANHLVVDIGKQFILANVPTVVCGVTVVLK